MKVCTSCKESKPIDCFYKHKAMKDKHLNKCKCCVKKRVSQHRSRNIEKIRVYDRNRGNRQGAGYVKSYRSKYPKKYKAHIIVNNALRCGNIAKPLSCEKCNKQKKIVAHHDDYDKPLDIRWLCYACHSGWHAKNGEGKNSF